MNWRKFVPRRRSGEIARKRLKVLLAADRTDCSPEFLEMLKADICQVVSKYVEIESGDIEMGITKTFFHGIPERVPALYANIPIRSLSYYKGTF